MFQASDLSCRTPLPGQELAGKIERLLLALGQELTAPHLTPLSFPVGGSLASGVVIKTGWGVVPPVLEALRHQGQSQLALRQADCAWSCLTGIYFPKYNVLKLVLQPPVLETQGYLAVSTCCLGIRLAPLSNPLSLG